MELRYKSIHLVSICALLISNHLNAQMVRKHDSLGRLVEINRCSCDKDGTFLVDSIFPCIMRFYYDQSDRLVKRTFHDRNGNLAENTEGIAYITRTYDTLSVDDYFVTHYGKNGIVKAQKSTNAAYIKYYYDEYRRIVVKTEYFDINWNKIDVESSQNKKKKNRNNDREDQ